MSQYTGKNKCDKVICQDQDTNFKCGATPTRYVPIIHRNICERHDKQLTQFIENNT